MHLSAFNQEVLENSILLVLPHNWSLPNTMQHDLISFRDSLRQALPARLVFCLCVPLRA